MKDYIKDFHQKSAPFLAHHQWQLSKANKYSLETAEIMAEMYDYALSLAIELDKAKKQLAWMDKELDHSHQDVHNLASMAEVKIYKRIFENTRSAETKALAKEYIDAHISHAKKTYYEFKKQNKVG